MRLDKLPVGEAIIGFLAVALIVTFLLARHEVKGTDNAAANASASAAGSATPSGSAAPGALEITMTDNKFDNATLTAAADTAQTINIKNNGANVHDVHISGANGQFSTAFCTTTGADPCSNPNRVGGGTTATLIFTLPAGTYQYRCDYHTADMTGTLTVK